MISHISAQKPAGLQAGGLLRVWGAVGNNDGSGPEVLTHHVALSEQRA